MNTKRRRVPAIKMVAIAAGLALLFSSAFAGDDIKKHYALIFGTVYGTDERPVYGVRITIHPVDKKKPSWELTSDHRGEFAQRVPPGPLDYEVKGEAVMAPVEEGKPQAHKKKKLMAVAKVHIDGEERQDISLHLTE
jgi:hypothetical protein